MFKASRVGDGELKAAKMYFFMSNPGPCTVVTGETHAPSFKQ